jgi:hypothetical protein
MKDVVLALAPALGTLPKEKVLSLFQQEVEEFSAWMSGLPDWKYQGPLSKQEKVMLVTYLMQKYVGNIELQRYTDLVQEAK